MYLKKFLKTSLVATLALSFINAQALTISPARAEITGDPGETISDSFLLINEQNSDETFYTSVENFDSQGESGTPNFTSSKEGLPTWIKVTDKVVLKKGERVKVPYSVVIPKDADSGGHFAAIFLSTVPPSTKDSQVSVGAKVGMLVLLKVTGNVTEKGGLLTFILKEEKKVLTSLPINFVYRFKNDGNDRVKPEGQITIKNMFGVMTASIDANQAMGNILPKSIRRYEVHYGEKEGPAVSAPFFEQVKFQMDNFAFGLYFADLDLKFGNQGTAHSSLTYFMFPWQLLTVVLVIALLAIALLTLMLRKYNQWIIKQARAAAK
jgi:hypothetical protein